MTETRGRLVLIVEDNPMNSTLARVVLERAGYSTTQAGSAVEARARLRDVTPDLILMDIQLPGEDGLSLTRELKADPVSAGIPIIALTAHAMPIDRERALAAGCDGYVVKPIRARTFPDEVAAFLQTRQAREHSA